MKSSIKGNRPYYKKSVYIVQPYSLVYALFIYNNILKTNKYVRLSKSGTLTVKAYNSNPFIIIIEENGTRYLCTCSSHDGGKWEHY